MKKAASALKSGSKRTKGWLGGEGGAQDLDKWYGVPLPHSSACAPLVAWVSYSVAQAVLDSCLVCKQLYAASARQTYGDFMQARTGPVPMSLLEW